MSTTEVTRATTGVGRGTWRAAFVLFLTILLGGLGLSGAQALWSQSSAVTAQVSTGTWVDYTRPGFSMPLTLSVDDAEGRGNGTRTIRLSWTGAEDVDRTNHEVTYRVTATEVDNLRVRGGSLPYEGSASEVTVRTTTPIWPFPPESLRLTVTPYVDGVAGEPTVKDLWLDRDRNTWLTDPQ